MCPNDCHDDPCITFGPAEGRCQCEDLVHSLDCDATVPGVLEWGLIVILLFLTLLIVLAGGVHYSYRRRQLLQQLEYAPIANADS